MFHYRFTYSYCFCRVTWHAEEREQQLWSTLTPVQSPTENEICLSPFISDIRWSIYATKHFFTIGFVQYKCVNTRILSLPISQQSAWGSAIKPLYLTQFFVPHFKDPTHSRSSSQSPWPTCSFYSLWYQYKLCASVFLIKEHLPDMEMFCYSSPLLQFCPDTCLENIFTYCPSCSHNFV